MHSSFSCKCAYQSGFEQTDHKLDCKSYQNFYKALIDGNENGEEDVVVGLEGK